MRNRERRPFEHSPIAPRLPLYGRVIGLRAWRLRPGDGGKIALCGQNGQPWCADGETTWAECHSMQRTRHRAPAGWCTCGLYALHPWEALGSSYFRPACLTDFQIAGVVTAWGRIQLHREGFRAQYARPIRLALIGSPRRSDYGRLIEDVAICHRCELVELSSAEELVAACEALDGALDRGAVERLLTP